jgi:hypothetical protein
MKNSRTVKNFCTGVYDWEPIVIWDTLCICPFAKHFTFPYFLYVMVSN